MSRSSVFVILISLVLGGAPMAQAQAPYTIWNAYAQAEIQAFGVTEDDYNTLWIGFHRYRFPVSTVVISWSFQAWDACLAFSECTLDTLAPRPVDTVPVVYRRHPRTNKLVVVKQGPTFSTLFNSDTPSAGTWTFRVSTAGTYLIKLRGIAAQAAAPPETGVYSDRAVFTSVTVVPDQ